MLPRERVQAAINFEPPRQDPVAHLPAAGGLHEHGQKLATCVANWA